MSRSRSVLVHLLVALGLSLSWSIGFAQDGVICNRERIASLDPVANRALQAAWEKGKKVVGRETTSVGDVNVYLTIVNGGIYAHSNFLPIVYGKRSKYPTKVWRGVWRENSLDLNAFDLESLTLEILDPLTKDSSLCRFQHDINFIIDGVALTDRKFGRLDFGHAERLLVIDGSGDLWRLDAYQLVSDNPELKQWAKQVGGITGAYIHGRISLSSLRDALQDRDVVRIADRLRDFTTRDLDRLKGALARYRDPEMRKASATDKVLALSDGKGGPATKVSDLLMRLRSGESVPAEWSAGDKKVVVLDVADLSATDTGRLAGKVLELVAEAAPHGDGPVPVFTKDPARARQRLTGFVDYDKVEFRNDEASLLKVERFGPLAKEILDGLVAGESDGPRFRFVVGHLDGDAAVLGRLIAEAKVGKFHDTHLGLFVCNNLENWPKFLELYDAAMEHGALSVTFPTRAINVPAMTLAAITLKRNPSFIRGNAPQTAVQEAYREAHRLLSEAAGTYKTDVKRRSDIGRAFGARAVEFFMVDGKLHQPTIDNILRALETDGVRMVTLATNSSPSTGSATASLNHGKRGDVG